MSKRAGQKAEQKTAARMVRDQLAKEQRRKRMTWTIVGVAAGAVILGMIAWGVIASRKTTEFSTPAGANSAGDGIASGKGPVTVDVYSDFLCPYCKRFHDESEAAVRKLVDEGKITLVYHPVAYLDQASTNRYPTRASAAAGCAADGGKYVEYSNVLFANQPAEGGPGPSNDDLIRFGAEVGLTDAFSQCVKDGRYVTWVGQKVNEDAQKAGVTGTPTVMVNGKKVNWDSASIVDAVTKSS